MPLTVEEIREQKIRSGYTAQQLSELSGVPLGTVQKILGGTTKAPRRETLLALERALTGTGVLRKGGATYGTQMPAGAGVLREGGVAYGTQMSAGSNRNILKEGASVYGIPGKKQGEYTLEDYYALPDEQRVELIDGVFYDMSSPTSTHQILACQIYYQLAGFVDRKGGSCLPLLSPMDVQLDCDDRTMVQPDVLIICDRSKVRRRVVYGAPDLIMEILSRSTRRKDLGIKMGKYMAAGVREYWVIYPEQKKIVVYDFEHEEVPAVYGDTDQVPVGIWNGACRVDFRKIFELVALYETDEQGDE